MVVSRRSRKIITETNTDPEVYFDTEAAIFDTCFVKITTVYYSKEEDRITMSSE